MAKAPPPPGLTRPHYQNWDMVERFPLWTAAWLLHDLEPRPMATGEAFPAFIKATVLELTYTLPPDAPPEKRVDTYPEYAADLEWQTNGPAIYCRETLRAWCERAGRPVPPFLLDPEERDRQDDTPGGYDTQMLALVRQTIREHWGGKDPARGPSQDAVYAWLRETYPDLELSQNEVVAIDLVTRPDTRRNRARKTHG